jgi:glycosyltransferase involved in cell wall biosynthesis
MSGTTTDKNPPVISVIIPTYNRAHLVGRAIRSVLAQTFQDWELIVVDDGSSDNTEEVVCSFQDPRICYISHEVNRGGSAARNTGIKVARGEYVSFLDSDDEWLPEKLEKQLACFRNTQMEQLGMVVCGRIDLDEKGEKVTEKNPDVHGWVYEDILNLTWSPSTPTMMIRYNKKAPIFLMKHCLHVKIVILH